MDTEKIIWNKRIPAPMKKWVIGAANTADTPGEEAALRFGKWWSEHGTMVAVGSAAQGREAISEAHRKAFTGVKSKRHSLEKVYSIDDDGSEVMVLGKLTSTMDDGKVVVVSFTVQVIFETPVGDDVEAKHWQIWIDAGEFL